MKTITWQIDSMNVSSQPVEGQTEVVLTAQWRCVGVEGDFSANQYGVCSFPAPQTGGSFTPYADLTQNQVVGWCWANGVDQTEVETNVGVTLEAKVNSPIITPPLPWVTPTTGA